MTTSKPNPKAAAYVNRAEKWRDELTALRQMLLRSGLSEELKWGKPCYALGSANVVILVAFKGYCALLFCKGALLKDAKGTLVAPSANTQAARQWRFTNLREIQGNASLIEAYVREAIAVEKAGLEVDYAQSKNLVFPEELTAAFARRPDLRAAFAALTPGRQRGYNLHFTAAKQSKTRTARIEKCAPRILAGKGLLD